MKPKHRPLFDKIERRLDEASNIVVLPGITSAVERDVFVKQMIDSIRRVDYVRNLAIMQISPKRADPASALFDPLKAAAISKRDGQIDEAFWLVFIATHFGKHAKYGWRLAQTIYGGLDDGTWTWNKLLQNPSRFRSWMLENMHILEGMSGLRFSNHRKYQSLRPNATTGTAAAVESYYAWVQAAGGHSTMIDDAMNATSNDPRLAFDRLYYSMDAVVSFGRMAKFDYLTMLGKLGLAPIEPGDMYFAGATGPIKGAKLLFGGRKVAAMSLKELNDRCQKLDAVLDVGMQVLEDAMCNWQKKPQKYELFRG